MLNLEVLKAKRTMSVVITDEVLQVIHMSEAELLQEIAVVYRTLTVGWRIAIALVKHEHSLAADRAIRLLLRVAEFIETRFLLRNRVSGLVLN